MLGVLAVAGVIAGSWRLAFEDGFIGEMFRMIVGVFSTPIMLESSLIVMGLIIVVLINTIRLKRQGDEFVYLEEVAEPDQAGLPEGARKVVYREKPEPKVSITALNLAEGAFELGDFQEAWSHLEGLDEATFDSEEALVLRLKLARATGKEASAAATVAKLRALNSGHPELKKWKQS